MQAWENFLTLQERELGVETVKQWLRPLKVLRFDACNLYLEAQDSFQTLWFEEHLGAKIKSSFVNNNNKKIKVHLSTPNEPVGKIPFKGKKKIVETPPPPPFLETTQLDPYCTFEHFVPSSGNHLAFHLLSEMAGYDPIKHVYLNEPKWPGFNPIYIYGSKGTGKTHLLMATAHALSKIGLKVIYIHTEAFTEHVVKAIREGEMSFFREAYRKSDVLIIDDAHLFSRRGATQEELFHTFNSLHLANKQIILSANCSPQQLQLIEPRLVSRFEWGIVIPIESLNSEEIAKALSNKAKALKFTLHHQVAEFLIKTFTSSLSNVMRALDALVLRTHMKKSSEHTPVITPVLAKHLLEDLIIEEEKLALTSDKIIQNVAEFYGICAEDILGKAQSRDCTLPRQLAMFLCRMRLKMPFMKIGEVFKRDHSTVMTSVKQIQKGINEANHEIVSFLAAIEKKLQA